MLKRSKQQRLLFVIAFIAFLSGILGLTYSNFKNNLMFFYYPAQLLQQQPASEVIRLGGIVEAGSIKKFTDGRVEFIVADTTHAIKVKYQGILPDLFREGQGVVVSGSMQNGVFQAGGVLAKHDENYKP